MLPRTLPAGFIAPCLPSKADKLPSGSQWLHEIKHDGFRIIARKNGAQVRLYPYIRSPSCGFVFPHRDATTASAWLKPLRMLHFG